MQPTANRLGLVIDRIEAVDARAVNRAELDRYFTDDGPLGKIGAGDKCCLLSHRLFWERLVASGDKYAIVIEDDAVLTSSAPRFFGNADWIPASMSSSSNSSDQASVSWRPNFNLFPRGSSWRLCCRAIRAPAATFFRATPHENCSRSRNSIFRSTTFSSVPTRRRYFQRSSPGN
jgi:Glycosyltransferase family 25 (LPS biosynthesis protein)